MSDQGVTYELPRKIERYLAALSRIYAKKGETQKQKIIVNSRIRVKQGWSHDNWNGGTYGHALYLVMPEPLYLDAVDQKQGLQNEIAADLNQVHDIQNEFIAEVFFEMGIPEERDWRKESEALLDAQRLVLPAVQKRIWTHGQYRVFLSHKTEIKREAAELKECLKAFGVSAFVAHEDIHPTKEWQNEIENALASMDAFVALMSEGFHDSLWTDQEVGYAFGRGVPIICLRLGKDPYGFIGKFQALSCDLAAAPREITRLLIKRTAMLDAYIAAVRDCKDFGEGNVLAQVLEGIESITATQLMDLISAFNENLEVRGSFGFNGGKPAQYGVGLPAHLSRITGRRFVLSDRKIVDTSKDAQA